MIYTKHIKHINVRENRRSNQEKIIFIVRYHRKEWFIQNIKHINVRENRRSNQEKIIVVVRYHSDLYKIYKTYKRQRKPKEQPRKDNLYS